MKYMLLIYMKEDAMSEAERAQCYKDSTQLACDLHSSGHFVAASPLQPIATATSVRLREGKRMITDGPFAETHEQLGGYYVIDAADLDMAIDIASKIPAAKRGTVEIRPIMELQGLPNM